MTSKTKPKNIRNWQDIQLPFTTHKQATLETCRDLDPRDGGWGLTSLGRLMYLGGPTEQRRFLGWLLDYEQHKWSTPEELAGLGVDGTIGRLTELVHRYIQIKGTTR